MSVSLAIERFLAEKKTGAAAAPAPPKAAVPQAAAAAVPQVAYQPKARPVDFVSEAEIRAALRRKEKILVGKKTIITPAARDLAQEYDILVVAE